MNNEFKLIAIRPLEGCESSKVLKQNEIYYFCNDYEINLTKGEIIYSPSIPHNLYNIPRANKDLEVNIHAIVGENGAGKSTILELLAMAINDISKIKGDFEHEIDFSNSNEPSHLTNVQIFFQIPTTEGDSEIQSIEIQNHTVTSSKYQGNNNIYKEFTNNNPVDFDELFYTFLANYALHALNEDYIGSWIYRVFFKNDAYQIPLNIYPLRSNGQININNEAHLTKSRLFSNVLINSNGELNSSITENQKVAGVLFKAFDPSVVIIDGKEQLVQKKVISIDGKDIYFEQLNIDFKKTLKLISNTFEIDFDESQYIKESEYGKNTYTDACNYVIRKLIKITAQYEKRYWDFFDGKELKFKDDIFEDYLTGLKDDRSVLTLKLRQALNFIDNWKIWNVENKFKLNDSSKLSIDTKTLSDIVYRIEPSPENFIDFIPPPIYEIDFILINKAHNFQPFWDNSQMPFEHSYFNSLSSGEKQMIFSIQSVVYHLLNLNSIHNISQEGRIKYKYANLMFDEIELYFHPEYQRKFISELLKGISRIHIPNIEAINMCFVTHSPFILSDIPEANCMFLKVDEDGKSKQCGTDELKGLKTFGANIHDMLRHGFFLKSGLIGDFALEKINDLIKRFHKALTASKKEQPSLFEYIRHDNKNIKNIINIIGDDIVKGKLLEMYAQIVEDDGKKVLRDYYQKKIDEL